MEHCETFRNLSQSKQDEVRSLIKKGIVRKSHVADIQIDDSDLPDYLFKVTVCKYNTVRGWATIGYIRDRNGEFILSFNPKRKDRRTRPAGRTGSYS